MDVKVPEVGESITEGVLVEWSYADGEMVAADTPLFTLETDKVTMEVNAEADGVLERLVDEGATVEVGQVVGRLDTEAEAPEESAASTASDDGDRSGEAEPPDGAEPAGGSAPAPEDDGVDIREAQREPERLANAGRFSPAVRRLVAEHDLDPSEIEGTGKGGRLTKGDVLKFVGERDSSSRPGTKAATGPRPVPDAPTSSKPAPEPSTTKDPGERQTRRQMSQLRRRIADRLVEVQQTAALLTTFNEVDMSGVMALRAKYKDAYTERHGVKLGFMSFFVKAAVDALKTVPEVNAFIDGDEIVDNHFYDIGVAVSSERGLVVPVLRECDRKSFAELEVEIGELAGKVRDKTITLDDLSGGVFTITNGGIFGSLLSTPIINPPQSAILGMHGIKERPVVVDGEIVARPMMYLALTYDHRLVDGREAVTFLRRIVETIEDPERLMLEV